MDIPLIGFFLLENLQEMVKKMKKRELVKEKVCSNYLNKDSLFFNSIKNSFAVILSFGYFHSSYWEWDNSQDLGQQLFTINFLDKFLSLWSKVGII
jgi:hypothetical protein